MQLDATRHDIVVHVVGVVEISGNMRLAVKDVGHCFVFRVEENESYGRVYVASSSAQQAADEEKY